MASARRTCAAPGCAVKFTPQRSTAKYHSTACRVRARRARTSPAEPAPPPSKKAPAKKVAAKRSPPATAPRTKKAAAPTGKKATPAAKRSAPAKKKAAPETKPAVTVDVAGLEDSVRRELEKADAVGTFAGQLALQLARRLVTPDETGISSLSKELRTVMAAALHGVTPPAAQDAATEDEVEKARRKREEARQAAGLT